MVRLCSTLVVNSTDVCSSLATWGTCLLHDVPLQCPHAPTVAPRLKPPDATGCHTRADNYPPLESSMHAPGDIGGACRVGLTPVQTKQVSHSELNPAVTLQGLQVDRSSFGPVMVHKLGN
ncbi:hypothetical protein PoB_001642300 [Plakobranchus ocellatus]|uniref:Uncharacterized protein n=1 Tax=Plakobranchus ocellatus TaxID=259542 RepID=A0AAV3Z639_9GAST|nr:hypothetical protein PoB_001642300 [Plakobranchus ocellatus]